APVYRLLDGPRVDCFSLPCMTLQPRQRPTILASIGHGPATADRGPSPVPPPVGLAKEHLQADGWTVAEARAGVVLTRPSRISFFVSASNGALNRWRTNDNASMACPISSNQDGSMSMRRLRSCSVVHWSTVFFSAMASWAVTRPLLKKAFRS